MSAPRFVEPGQQIFVTVSAVGRQMRFVPTMQVRESIWFIFTWLLSKTSILIHEFNFMGDHFHFVATDPKAEHCEFLRIFDSMLSRQLNALRGATGSNFEKHPGWQRICDEDTVIQKCVYTMVNPLRANLVGRLRDWKAPTTFALEYGVPVVIMRPKCGLWSETRAKPADRGPHESRGRRRYRGRSTAPESVTFTLARPQVRMDLSDSELRQHIRTTALEEERVLRLQSKKSKRSPLGWARVVSQHYLSVPRSSRVLFRRTPLVTGTDKAKVRAMLQTMQLFRAEYRIAMQEHRARNNPTFPYGTNQMARRYNVPCTPTRPNALAPPPAELGAQS